MTTERQVKASRIAKRLCELSDGLPDEHKARRFLTNAVRLERIFAGRNPFSDHKPESVITYEESNYGG